MSNNDSRLRPGADGDDSSPESEGGLRAPPGLSDLGKIWWWFHFLILVKIARLRFVGLLLVIGLVIVNWVTVVAHYERWTRKPGAVQAAGSDVEYFCPMHPAVIRDNPNDKCPVCFMALSKRKKGAGENEPLPPGIVNRVQLSPYRIVLAGIRTWQADYVPLAKEITTVGFVEFNEREMKQVSARVKGRIDKLVVNETGSMVHAGDELASLYSPDLLVTVQNLIDARQSGNVAMQRASRDRLTLWGVSDDQIVEIEKTGKRNTHIKIRSPIDGHVIKKYVREGQYVEEGSPLYDIVNLSSVWMQGQVFEDDMAFLPAHDHIHKGPLQSKHALPVIATTRAFPTEKFEGKLTFVYPHVDQETRTIVVRFELDNADGKLRPGTSTTVKLEIPPVNVAIFSKTMAQDWAREYAVDLVNHAVATPSGPVPAIGVESMLRAATRYALLNQGRVLAVPETSVIDTGKQTIVYRQRSPGLFEGVTVELGPRMVGANEVTFYPVFKGISAGDMIVTSGSFLVDAETRLNPAAGSIYFGGSSGVKGGQQSDVINARPSMPEDEQAIEKVEAKENIAKLPSAEDRRLAESQEFCPIEPDNRLGSMGMPFKVILEGRPVFLCCKGCEGRAKDKPKETLEILDKMMKSKPNR